jgi:hypothetical protein
VKNEKLSKIKAQIKKQAPLIITATIAIATTTYAILQKIALEEELEKSSEHKTLRMALGDCCIDEMKKGESTIWEYDGLTIDLAYDPELGYHSED